ncbi:MAG TPA: UDP-2,3-diacylglucosamine diphosphatase [Candidatus Saccharimonadales bacterium]|nr:UDP-2,3-diacylglucosamine diphosphatase [Candidatus Saccharimonadales bacterium]
MAGDRAYFFSDAHLRPQDAPGEERKRRYLLEFLASVRSRPGPLFLNGDLFDFWFEYRHAIPRGHLEVLSALCETRRAGVPLTYVGGNHDFWLGDFLVRELGARVEMRPLELELQGRRIFLAHGDGMMPGDLGYQILKAILRSRINIWLYRWVHPDVGVPLALAVSRLSYRSQRHHRIPPGSEILRHVAEPRFRLGHDAVVLGHFHLPFHHLEPGRELVVLGDWIHHFTYATLEDGRFRLWQWTDGGPREFQAEP